MWLLLVWLGERPDRTPTVNLCVQHAWWEPSWDLQSANRSSSSRSSVVFENAGSSLLTLSAWFRVVGAFSCVSLNRLPVSLDHFTAIYTMPKSYWLVCHVILRNASAWVKRERESTKPMVGRVGGSLGRVLDLLRSITYILVVHWASSFNSFY